MNPALAFYEYVSPRCGVRSAKGTLTTTSMM
jgi:hypothetical protein